MGKVAPGERKGESAASRIVPARLTAAFAAALLLAAAATWVTFRSARERRDAPLAVAHTLTVIAEINSTLQQATDLGRSLRGYLIAGQRDDLPDREGARRALEAGVARLAELTGDNPRQRDPVRRLAERVASYLRYQEHVLATAESEGLDAARQLWTHGEGERLFAAVREALREMHAVEEALLRERQLQAALAERRSLGNLAAVAALLFAALVASFFLIRNALADRLRAEAAVRDANAGLERRVRERTAELDAQRRHNELLLNSVGEGLYGLDLDGRVTFANPAGAEILGYTVAELLGQPMHAKCHHTHADGRPFPREECPIYAAFKDGRTHQDSSDVMWRKDGGPIPIEYASRPLRDEAGRLSGAMVVFRDITARKRAEAEIRERTAELERTVAELRASERHQQQLAAELALEQEKLATAFDHMETGVVLSDARGGGMTMNPAALKILGFASVAEAHARIEEYAEEWEIRDAAGRVLPFAEWPLPRAVAGHYYRDLEFSLRHLSSGHETVCSFTGVPVRDAAGEVAQVLLTLHDVTGRKRAEAEILALNAELEQKVESRTRELSAANRELEAFAYSVSHDLRAPLRHVNGFVELVERTQAERLDDTGRRYFRVIAEASAKMGRLIDDLLAFSRVGRVELKRERVELGALVEEARRALEPEAAGREIDWRIAPLPAVEGDPALLRQVFANLLGNSLKYSRQRTPAVVEVGLCEAGDGETVVQVRDNGVGFDMQYVDQLFGVFRRLHRDEEFEGTGVGLALVRRIVERHGGHVWAEGRPGEGASFYVALPSGAPDADRSPEAP